MVNHPQAQPSGSYHPAFEAVARTFEKIMAQPDQIGAALCVYLEGQEVVNLHSGWTDEARTKPWQENTVVNIWSTTKGVGALCFAMAADRGLFDYEHPVARYWPEFAACGKGNVTIGQLLSHQAGLSALGHGTTLSDLCDLERAATLLAGAEPLWVPGSAAGYHLVTFGPLLDALFQRIEGRSLSIFIEEEIARPFEVDIQIGARTVARSRISPVFVAESFNRAGGDVLSEIQHRTFTEPPLEPLIANTEEWLTAELVSANGVSNASALAKLYDVMLGGKLLSMSALERAIDCRIDGNDLVLALPFRWGAGFALNSNNIYGPNPRAFGHNGWGGSFAIADPDANLAIAFTTNTMAYRQREDPRSVSIVEAAFASLGSRIVANSLGI